MNLTIIIPTNKDDFLPRLLRHYKDSGITVLIKNDPRSITEIFQQTKVDTDYVVFCGDDDFIDQEGAKSCIEFLDNNLEFIACHGTGIYFTEKNGSIEAVSPMPLWEIIEDTAEGDPRPQGEEGFSNVGYFPYEEALSKLAHENMKKFFFEAWEFLKKN